MTEADPNKTWNSSFLSREAESLFFPLLKQRLPIKYLAKLRHKDEPFKSPEGGAVETLGRICNVKNYNNNIIFLKKTNIKQSSAARQILLDAALCSARPPQGESSAPSVRGATAKKNKTTQKKRQNTRQTNKRQTDQQTWAGPPPARNCGKREVVGAKEETRGG